MIKTLIFSLCILLTFPASADAQKKKKRNESNTTEISSETRQQSVIFADGLRNFYSDNMSAAETNFRNVLYKNSKNDAAYYMLSKIRSSKEDYAGAAFYMEEARKIDKNNVWYLIELAEIYDNMGDYKNSSKLWEEVCRQKTDNEYYLFALADSYLEQERYLDVIKTYTQMEKILGMNDDISDAKKNIYLYLNDVKSAVGEYERLINAYPYEVRYYLEAGNIYMTNNMPDKAYPFYERALTIDPENPLTQLTLANYYSVKGDSEKSYNATLSSFKSPNLPIEEKLPALTAYFSLAAKNGDPAATKKAVQLTDALLKAHPESFEAWSIMGGLQLLENRYSEAKVSFEKALALNNSQFTVWEDYLYTLEHLEDYQAMANCAKEVTELFPTHSIILYNIGVAYMKLNQPEQAVEYLNQASLYAYEMAFLASIYDLMGDAYMKMDNATEAVKNWKLAQRKGLNSQEIKDKITNAEQQ